VRLPLSANKLIEQRSDQQDMVELANDIRRLAVSEANEFPRVETEDATPTVIWQDTLPANGTADLYVVVVGGTADGVSAATYHRRAAFRRPGILAAVLIGVDTIGTDKETVGAWDITVEVDPTVTGGVRVTVTGAAATDISWRANVVALVTPW
jgi:hypothetical protein